VGTVGVDFDKVVHAYRRGWHDGTIYDGPVDGAFEGLDALMMQHSVFIFTSRDPKSVSEWLAKAGFATTTEVPARGFWDERGRLLVTNRKLPALAYLDDRGVRFTSWDQALADLRELRVLR
jgi:hypothetical protein